MIGIAIAGWDRLGWSGGWAERWMRSRDRAPLLACIILFAAYLVIIMGAILKIIDLLGWHKFPSLAPALVTLLTVNIVLLGWRVLVRMYFVWQLYGAPEAMRSIPRMIVGNVIAILAARRAVFSYIKMTRTGSVRWDKTSHKFPLGPKL